MMAFVELPRHQCLGLKMAENYIYEAGGYGWVFSINSTSNPYGTRFNVKVPITHCPYCGEKLGDDHE